MGGSVTDATDATKLIDCGQAARHMESTNVALTRLRVRPGSPDRLASLAGHPMRAGFHDTREQRNGNERSGVSVTRRQVDSDGQRPAGRDARFAPVALPG